MPALALLLLLASSPPSPASQWMAVYTASDQPLNFDAVIGLAQLRELGTDAALEAAFARANARLDRDRGHPQRRFFEPGFRLPPELSRGWDVPQGAAPRANPDRVVTEALYCAENGWRAETEAYACGAMRDGGGYQSAHALWALVLARRNGCLDAAGLACLERVRRELAQAQPLVPAPWSALDIDLFAERLVMLQLAGPLPAGLGGGLQQLRALQGADGSWGPGAEEIPYLRFHATLVSAWALALAGANAQNLGTQKLP